MNNKEKLPVPPPLKTDEAAERFIDQADLTRFDLSRFRSMNFEFEKKTARVNMRLPEPLLRAVKAKAQTRGIPYQRLIREAIERALEDESA
jgi:predicted DNA binding CopG/RHH family protein